MYHVEIDKIGKTYSNHVKMLKSEIIATKK